jgi:chromatin segregation and condensation protein Rec8/ScpA/Scc1 (kleisin family)
MAAWLAYLKSRLILPQEKGPDGEPTATRWHPVALAAAAAGCHARRFHPADGRERLTATCSAAIPRP